MAVAIDSELNREAAEFSVSNNWQSDRRGPARWLYSHIARHKIYMLGILLGALGNAYGGAIMPILIGRAFNAINRPAPDTNALLTAALLVVLSQVLRAVVQFWRNFSSEVISQRIERDIRSELYASLIGKSMAFHDRQRVGEVMARVTNDVRQVNYLMTPGVNIVVGSGSFLVFPILLAPQISPQLVIVPILFVVFYALAVYRFVRRLAGSSEAERTAFGRMNAALAEVDRGR